MNETYVTVVGNVADDPRHLQTAGGVMTAFRLAQTPRRERDGQWSNGDTSFYDVTCFRKLADHVAGSVAKGDPVIVHGRLSLREWQRDDRRGCEAAISASHVGHDLVYGVSTFARPRRAVDPVEAVEDAPFAEPDDGEEPDGRADSAA